MKQFWKDFSFLLWLTHFMKIQDIATQADVLLAKRIKEMREQRFS